MRAQDEAGNGSAVLDVATALVCAPDVLSWDTTSGIDIMEDTSSRTPLQRRMTLREALKIEAENAPKLHKTDPVQAETAIRLHRRVETQMAVQQQPLIPPDAMGGLDVALHGALDAALDDAIAGGIGNGQSIEDVINAETDLMTGLITGADGMEGDIFSQMGDGITF